MRELLKKLVGYGVAHARQILIEQRQKQLTPFFHLVNRHDEGVVIMAIWHTPFEKQMALAAARKTARDIGAKAAMFVGEAWFYRSPNDALTREQINRGDYIPPSEHPNRLECVMILATDGTHQEGVFYEIIRNKHTKKIIDLVKDEQLSSMPEAIEANMMQGFIKDVTH